MHASVNQWGNSLAIRIPSKLARAHGLEAGSEVDLVEREDGTLQLRPRGPTLARMVAGINSENVHGETSFGAPVGRETF